MEGIEPGLTGTCEVMVTPTNTARHLGSGGVEVFATPEMVRLMERAALAAVDPLLPPGWQTVGARIEVEHLAPTPTGMRVQARAELVAVEGRRLTFAVEVYDERELVGRGRHERVAIDVERFRRRVAEKQAAG
jgi:fluoroacetyl-CoA thioesterase